MDKFWHEHPVVERARSSYINCAECQGNYPLSFSERYKEHVLEKRVNVANHKQHSTEYACNQCRLIWHPSCVPSSPEDINHPCHPNHPLELFLKTQPSSNWKCSLCQRKLGRWFYHCKLCDFSVDVRCANDSPPLKVDHPKCHDHALTLMGRDVSFTCNACGTHGERNPYVCLPCSSMFHYDCLDRPHVININRHNHRISHASPLSREDRICEICRKDINWRYGAYSCNKCPNYFVHSKCATHEDVWDGVELQGIPEEEVDTAPFKVIDEGIINHFSHEKHNLLLIEDVIIDGGGEDIRCEGCCRPISFDRYYNCLECDFRLHEECANFPLQIRHAATTSILSLSCSGDNGKTSFVCSLCRRITNGFRYWDGNYYRGNTKLDVHCASVSRFRHRKLHPHTLFITTIGGSTYCQGCHEGTYGLLDCTECNYSLDFGCATLPVVIKHRCDDHFLFLSSSEKAIGKYWCEICEAETDPKSWFYTCHDCGVVCHIDCVIVDSLNVKPGLVLVDEKKGTKVEAVLNNQMTRPRCYSCRSRCMAPNIYKTSRINGWSNRNLTGCTIKCAFKNRDCV